ncbi:J domain-containing protein [Sphingomonas sp. LT1P40]|uniref:J domain-containing protein n=1 Tax=Alteristakelama amylovorans TaxID=3096166 RepID=UPI002FC78B75
MKPWWDVLGVPRGSDRAVIRRAYAKQLKVTNPEDDPEGFMTLRQAYESALNWVDYDDYDYDEGDGDETSGAFAGGDAVQRTEWAERSAEPAEPDPFAETRAADQADLRRRTAALEAGLRGPWHGDAAALAARLDAILGAPALIEIDTRDSIEYWLSNLLADTVPRSDAILIQAVETFGWEDEGNHPPAVWRILSRIDEWRMIESLNNSNHDLSAGWRTLTRGKEPDWQRRIGALRPGVAAQVQQLFDLAGYQVPGIVHSFEPHAAAWWRDHLDKPRFGFLDLGALLIAAIGALICTLAIEPLTVRIVSAVAALVAGIGFAVVRLRIVAPWRRRREEMGFQPGWSTHGWAGLWLAAALLIIWTPASDWMAGIVAALCAVASLWMAVAVGREPQIGNVLGRVVSFGALALLGAAAFFALSGPEKLALLAFAAASMLIGATGAGAIAELLWRAGARPVMAAAVLAGLLLAAAAGRSWLPAAPQPLLPWGAAAITGMVLMAAVREQHDGSWAARMAPFLRWGLWIVLVVAAVMSAPEIERRPVELPIQQLERNEPGFTALKDGNPGLYAAVSAVWQQQADGKRSRDEASREIDRLVNIAYRARLPEASSALLASEFDIRLATMREYRTLDLRACAAGEQQDTSRTLSKELLQRHYRHALAVAASSPTTVADGEAGREVATTELLRVAANGDARRSAALNDAMRGSDLKAKCDARIALMEALSAQPDADVAKTMRPALIARAAESPPESSAKPKSGDQAP